MKGLLNKFMDKSNLSLDQEHLLEVIKNALISHDVTILSYFSEWTGHFPWGVYHWITVNGENITSLVKSPDTLKPDLDKLVIAGQLEVERHLIRPDHLDMGLDDIQIDYKLSELHILTFNSDKKFETETAISSNSDMKTNAESKVKKVGKFQAETVDASMEIDHLSQISKPKNKFQWVFVIIIPIVLIFALARLNKNTDNIRQGVKVSTIENKSANTETARSDQSIEDQIAILELRVDVNSPNAYTITIGDQNHYSKMAAPNAAAVMKHYRSLLEPSDGKKQVIKIRASSEDEYLSTLEEFDTWVYRNFPNLENKKYYPDGKPK